MKTICYINSLTTSDALVLDIKTLVPDANMRRRMSRVVKMGVSTAMEALAGAVPASEIDAVVTASGFGCLADSEKFLRNILEQDEELLNPTPFIQSTFNTVGAQIALLCQNHSYNTTYSHRGRSFESALIDAAMRISDAESARVLVGVFDEQTPSQHRIMERMGFWRKNICGEGATFMVLSDIALPNSVARIVEINILSDTLLYAEILLRYRADRVVRCDYSQADCYPTASARSVVAGVEAIVNGAQRVALYNSYRGDKPTVIILECL